jgi:hypothetical protein
MTDEGNKATDVHDIMLKLDADNDPLLFILLASDGSINRIGSGALKDKNRDMFIGKSDPAIFARVLPYLTEEILWGLGKVFSHKSIQGMPCKLTIMLRFNDGTSGGSEYHYGSESESPPRDVVYLVTAAVRETEGWYQEQLRMVSSGG